MIPHRKAREEKDEKHLCPLQLDTIARALTLWSNPGDAVLTPFLGVGSEVFQSVSMGRKAVGVELKAAYFKQAVLNCTAAAQGVAREEMPLFGDVQSGEDEG